MPARSVENGEPMCRCSHDWPGMAWLLLEDVSRCLKSKKLQSSQHSITSLHHVAHVSSKQRRPQGILFVGPAATPAAFWLQKCANPTDPGLCESTGLILGSWLVLVSSRIISYHLVSSHPFLQGVPGVLDCGLMLIRCTYIIHTCIRYLHCIAALWPETQNGRACWSCRQQAWMCLWLVSGWYLVGMFKVPSY